MTEISAVLALMSTAVLVLPGGRTVRTRLLPVVSRTAVPSWLRWVGLGAGCAALPIAVAMGGIVPITLVLGGAALLRWRRKRTAGRTTDPLALASAWDLLAVTLRAGMPVSIALRAAAGELSPAIARPLREVASLLTWGAEEESAWRPALAVPETRELARAVRRTTRTGCALADAVEALARDERAAVGQRARACAQRAVVWVTVPLGLCFLPAFLCLGVGPVVLSMVSSIRSLW